MNPRPNAMLQARDSTQQWIQHRIARVPTHLKQSHSESLAAGGVFLVLRNEAAVTSATIQNMSK